MINSRQKGKRGERWAAGEIREFFPGVKRNAMQQSREGGVDLEGTPGFSFEIKIGKLYQSKMIRNILDQMVRESHPDTYRVGIVKPDHEDPYVMIPLDDFKKILAVLTNRE